MWWISKPINHIQNSAVGLGHKTTSEIGLNCNAFYFSASLLEFLEDSTIQIDGGVVLRSSVLAIFSFCQFCNAGFKDYRLYAIGQNTYFTGL